MSALDLFSRLSEGHKPDCLLSLEGPSPEAVPDPAELARVLGSQAVAAYAQACRPVYEDLRRVIGQLSGLLILARLTSRAEMADLGETARCEARWRDAGDRLAALVPPQGLARHKAQLESAQAFCGQVMQAFGGLRPRADNTERLDRMSVQIKRAYTHLEAASSSKAKLEMVDFTHACCSCAHDRQG